MGGARAGGSWLSAKRPVVRFVLVFAVLTGGLYLGITGFVGTDLHTAYLRLNARVSGAVLHVFGTEATVTGQSIGSARFSMRVVSGCDALDPAALLVAAVVAFPAAWRAKLLAIPLGLLFVLIVNLTRIVSLFYIGIHFPNAFDMMHFEVWQAAFIFLVLLFWVVWARCATRRVG